jgi:hypothetical protein
MNSTTFETSEHYTVAFEGSSHQHYSGRTEEVLGKSKLREERQGAGNAGGEQTKRRSDVSGKEPHERHCFRER